MAVVVGAAQQSSRPSPWRHACLGAVILAAGCGRGGGPSDPLSEITAELDAAVADRDVTTIRARLADATPAVRALAAQAASAGADWDSMPTLIELLDDDDAAVRARAFAACASLLGMDHGHDPLAPAADRARSRDSIRRAYETMRRNPPPHYRN